MPNAYKPDVVLLDVAASSVLRVLHSGPISQANLDSRVRLSRHVDAPRFAVLGEGRLIREEFVHGLDFATLSAKQRLDAYKRLLVGYTGLAARERSGSAGTLFDSAVEAIRKVGLPPVVTAQVLSQAKAVRSEVGRWPLAPSHGDISAENLIVREGRPVLLDLEWAGWAPFCFDPLWLIIREASTDGRRDLFEAFMDGTLDPDLEALWCAAGLRLPRHKDGVLAVIMILRAYEAATNNAVTSRDRLRRYTLKYFALLPYTDSAKRGTYYRGTDA